MKLLAITTALYELSYAQPKFEKIIFVGHLPDSKHKMKQKIINPKFNRIIGCAAKYLDPKWSTCSGRIRLSDPIGYLTNFVFFATVCIVTTKSSCNLH